MPTSKLSSPVPIRSHFPFSRFLRCFFARCLVPVNSHDFPLRQSSQLSFHSRTDTLALRSHFYLYFVHFYRGVRCVHARPHALAVVVKPGMTFGDVEQELIKAKFPFPAKKNDALACVRFGPSVSKTPVVKYKKVLLRKRSRTTTNVGCYDAWHSSVRLSSQAGSVIRSRAPTRTRGALRGGQCSFGGRRWVDTEQKSAAGSQKQLAQ